MSPAPTPPELAERRSVARGLLVLAVVVMLFSIARAGFSRLFYEHWWRQW